MSNSKLTSFLQAGRTQSEQPAGLYIFHISWIVCASIFTCVLSRRYIVAMCLYFSQLQTAQWPFWAVLFQGKISPLPKFEIPKTDKINF